MRYGRNIWKNWEASVGGAGTYVLVPFQGVCGDVVLLCILLEVLDEGGEDCLEIFFLCLLGGHCERLGTFSHSVAADRRVMGYIWVCCSFSGEDEEYMAGNGRKSEEWVRVRRYPIRSYDLRQGCPTAFWAG